MSVQARKSLALRLYGCILDKCGSFEAFKRLLREEARVRESTVRGWLPPLTRLNLDPIAGGKVLKRDWESVRSPDFPSIVELAQLLNVSVDYLLGFPVPKRLTDRQPVGELSVALLDYLISEYPTRRAAGMTYLSFPALSEALDGERRSPYVDDFNIRLDPLAVLNRVVDMVYANAQELQDQQDAKQASEWSGRISDVAGRARALYALSKGLRRDQLWKLLGEIGQVAIDPEYLSAVLWLNSIEEEIRLAESEKEN